MGRAVWTGVLNIGLVSLPVCLYPAHRERALRFELWERGTGDRIRTRRVNERSGAEVPLADTASTVAGPEGRSVPLEPAELDRIAPGRGRSIDVELFVDPAELDPLCLQRSYYLAPHGDRHDTGYLLLCRALMDTGRVGIGTCVIHGRAVQFAVGARDGVLTAQTLAWAEDVLDPREVCEHLPEPAAPPLKELRATRQLIEAATDAWRAEEHRDGYAERLRELVSAKDRRERERGRGRAVTELPTPEPPAREPTEPADLLDALHDSVLRADAGRALAGLGKAELYRLAALADVPGRSTMTRAQLREALEERDRELHPNRHRAPEAEPAAAAADAAGEQASRRGA